jgi:hypothetical protein
MLELNFNRLLSGIIVCKVKEIHLAEIEHLGNDVSRK